MKVSDIIQTKNYQFKKLPKDFFKGLKKLGAGGFATVYEHPTDPHLVIKREKDFSHAYRGYIKWVDDCRKKAGSNPYLPRVYEVYYEQEANSFRYTYVLERLWDPQQVISTGKMSNEQLLAMADKMFGGKSQKFNDFLKRTKPKQLTPEKIWGEIAISTSKALKNDINIVADPELKEAINLLKRTIGTDCIEDICYDNLMMRVTPTGAQLVLSDPVADNDYSW